MRDFAHATSMANIENILSSGLSEEAAKASSKRGLVNRPGSFFTVEVTPEDFGQIASELLVFGYRHDEEEKPAITYPAGTG